MHLTFSFLWSSVNVRVHVWSRKERLDVFKGVKLTGLFVGILYDKGNVICEKNSVHHLLYFKKKLWLLL